MIGIPNPKKHRLIIIIDPLVNIYITIENHHFNGNTHYKLPFSIAVLNYQRVTLAILLGVHPS